MITHRNSLDVCPGGVPLFIRLSQYDSSFTLIFDLFSHKGNFTVESGTTARFRELKPDGNALSIDASISGTTVTLAPSQSDAQQITAIAGNCKCELSLFKGDKELNTANFTLLIEKAVIDKDTPYSDSVIRELIDVTDRADEIMEAAETVDEAIADLPNLIDKTLTLADHAADSKTVGDKITVVNDKLDQLFTDHGKRLLLSILKQATYLSDVKSLIDSLEEEILSAIITIGPIGVIEISNAKHGLPVALLLDVLPVQNLNGYEYPWAEGKGKNLVPYFPSGSRNGVTYTVDSKGVVAFNGTATGMFLVGANLSFKKDSIYYVNGAPSITNAGFTVRNQSGGVINDNGIVFGTGDFNGESGRLVSAQDNYAVQMLARIGNGATLSSSVKWYPMIIEEGNNNHLSGLYSSVTKGGITFTVDSDGVITVNGTASDVVTYGVYVTLPAGDYVVGPNRSTVMLLKMSETGARMDTVDGFTGDARISHRGGMFSIDREMTMWCGFDIAAGTYSNKKLYAAVCDRLVTDLSYSPYSNICPFTAITDITMKHGASSTNYQTDEFDVSQQSFYSGIIDFVNKTLKKHSYYPSYSGEALAGKWVSSKDKYESGKVPTVGAEVIDLDSLSDTGISVEQIILLDGNNRLWSDNGDTTLTYEKKKGV